MGFGDESFEDVLVEWARQRRAQERPGVTVAERSDVKLRQPFQRPAYLASREEKGDAIRQESSRHEGQDLLGPSIEPVRVIDDAQQRLLLGSVGQQTQDGEPDEIRVGRRPTAAPEGDLYRLSLGMRVAPPGTRSPGCKAAGARRTAAPSRPRHRPRERRGTKRPARSRTRATTTCRSLDRHGRPGRRHIPLVPRSSVGRSPRVRADARQAVRWPSSSRDRAGGGAALICRPMGCQDRRYSGRGLRTSGMRTAGGRNHAPLAFIQPSTTGVTNDRNDDPDTRSSRLCPRSRVGVRPGAQRAGLLRRARRTEPLLGDRRRLQGRVPHHLGRRRPFRCAPDDRSQPSARDRRDRIGERRQQQGQLPRALAPPHRPRGRLLAVRQGCRADRPR